MIIALEKPALADLFGQLVNRLTGNGGYCHCEVVLSDGTAITSLPTTGLTRHRRDYPASQWVKFDIGGDNTAESLALQWYEAEKGTPYDWRGVLSYEVPSIQQNPNEWYCSEATVAVVQWALGAWQNVVPWKVSPNGLAQLLIAAAYPQI